MIADLRGAHTQFNIFGAFVGQGTLEAAANEMAAAAGAYPELASEFRHLLGSAGSSATEQDSNIKAAVNCSGYCVSTTAEAAELCGELLALFDQAMVRT